MENPFTGLMIKPVNEERPQHDVVQQRKLSDEQRKQKRDELYAAYTPMVNQILDMLISACMPGAWQKGSDLPHEYCCHISWFAGPAETHHANYDEHHEIRRKIEITLDLDNSCAPLGFRVRNQEIPSRVVHVGLSKEALVGGITAVLQ